MLQALQKETNTPQGNVLRPTLDKRFIVDLKGKEFVTYAGLLDLAHQHGLTELRVDLVQFPSPENNMECIVQATAVTESGALFSDLGDANPQNTSKSVAQHIIRMASTRAKARVLRDLSNIGMTALKELGDVNGDIPGNGNGSKKPRQVNGKGNGKACTQPKPGNGNDNAKISDAQKRAIWALAKSRGHDENTLHAIAESTFGCGVVALSSGDAATLITRLQAEG